MTLSTTHKNIIAFLALSQVIVLWIFYNRSLLSDKFKSYYGAETNEETNPSNTSVHLPRMTISQLSASENATKSATRKAYRTSVAIGLGFTTMNAYQREIKMMPFFRSLMPSFCKTASDGYDYQFFLAYDYNDKLMSNRTFVEYFQKTFATLAKKTCPSSSDYSIHFIVCGYAGKPAWAQNDAMIEAYLAGMEYFYRINDDTRMVTRNWTERFIDSLQKLTPPLVGVVGPTHQGGNTAILTYDFTHRSHIDIHGFHYPSEFPDWYSDRWITDSYKPGRSIKCPDVRLVHTMESGQRYRNSKRTAPQVYEQVAKAREKIIRYAVAKETRFQQPDPKKVIAISLYNASSAMTWGVVRNAQLMPIIYPGWTLHVYTSRRLIGRGPHYKAVANSYISDRVIKTLESLRAEVVYVEAVDGKRFPAQLWSYLVADRPEVRLFLIRGAEQRLIDREVAVLEHWSQLKKAKAVYCMKDHPKHLNRTFLDGLWGAKSEDLRSLLGHITMQQFIETHTKQFSGNQQELVTHIENILYEKVKKSIVYYDSITCQQPHSLPFPIARIDSFYVGQKYNSREQPVLNERFDVLRSTSRKCDGKS